MENSRLNDFDFLDSTGLNFYISHLIGILLSSNQKPENHNEFCEKYFLKVASCQCVIGSDFNFISGCKHNRRAFVFCLYQVSASLEDEVTVAEFQQIVEQLCPDFPFVVCEEASRLIDGNSTSRPSKYVLRELLLAFSFQFLFLEWLREFDRSYFAELKDVTKGLHLTKTRNIIDGISRGFPLSLDQPTMSMLENSFESLSTGTETISRESLKRALFESPSTALFLKKIKYMAPSLNGDSLSSELKTREGV